jgi:carboxypeptidase family protein
MRRKIPTHIKNGESVMQRLMYIVAAGFAALLFSTLIAQAQTTSGNISGRVVDPSGAAIAGAQVTLTNPQTSQTLTTSSDRSGNFVFASVQPGTFTVTVSAPGFKQFDKRDLHLSASERLAAGTIQLEVGAATQTVTVTAEATAVQSQSGERSALLDTNELQHLSTPGRDVLALVRLLPGVVKDGEGASQLGTESAGAVSGTREVSNSISLDGVNGNPRGGGNRFDTPLNMEAVSEVKVLLNSYQAEYGQSGGAIVNIVTKSGTRNFHGEGYYYGRNEDFNANDTFNKHAVSAANPNGLPRSQYRFNTIGYNLGGPVYWPGKVNKDKNKLFFFFSQEIWPTKTPGTTRYFMMPTDLEKQGDFSQSVDKQGDKVTLTDPRNCGIGNQACLLNSTHINPAFINANTQALLNVLPTGNPTPLGTAPGGGLYNYIVQATVEKPVNQQVLRLDYNITDKMHMFFRGMNMTNNTKGPTDSPGLNAQMQWGPSFFYDTPARNAAIGLTWTASPTLVNEFTAGYADWRERSGFVNPSDLAKVQRGSSTGVDLGQFNPTFNPLNLIPNASFGGGGTSASGGFGISNDPAINFYTRFPFNNNTGTWEYTDGLTKVWDKHTTKFGVYWQNGRYVQHPIGNQFNGTYSFNVTPANVTDAGYAYANALLGNYNSYTEGNRTVYAPKWKIFEWYAQDNWKITPKLTLDYGLRFSYDFPYTLDPGAGVSFVPGRYDPSQVPVLYQPVTFASLTAARQALCSAGSKSKPSSCAQNPNNPNDVQPSGAIGQFVGPFNFTGSVVNTDPTYPHALRNSNGVLYAPRLGIAFDPWGDGKTAIRAGAGVFYNLREDAGVVGDFSTQPPVIGNTSVSLGNIAGFTPNCNTLAGGCANVSNLTAPQNTTIMPTNHKIASTFSTNFGVQRDLGFSTVLDISYVGTFGRHLEVTPNINEVPYLSQFLPQNIDPTKSKITSLNGTVVQQAAKNDNFFRPTPGYATMNLREYTGTSNYHALQTTVNRKFSRALEFGLSYTWSKTMSYADTTSTGTAGSIATYQDPRFWNYSEANIDRTNNLIVHWVYSLPKASNLWNNPVIRAVADNWEWSGISEFVSGAPQSVTLSVSNLNFTGGGDGTRILLFGNPYAPADQRHTSFEYLNTSAFGLPPVASKSPGVIDPSAIPNPGMPGITRANAYRGPGTNNWDMTLAKNIPITEHVAFQLRCEAYNVFNHVSFNAMQNTATYSNTTGQLTTTSNFGALTGDRGPRILQLVGKITF